jgi:purine-binding chemotaxis protein CheW
MPSDHSSDGEDRATSPSDGPTRSATRTRRGATKAGKELAQHGQYCTFRLAGLAIGIDVRRVQEVLKHDQMTPVPLAPPEVRGLINLRGQIVTAIDLRHQLGLGVDGQLTASVVVRAGDEAVSLLVEEVGDVVEPSPDDYEPVPAAVPARVRDVVTGTFKLAGMLLLVLDPDRVITRLEAASGSSRQTRRST